MPTSNQELQIKTTVSSSTELKTLISTPAEIKVNIIGTGPSGNAMTYTHRQITASTTWEIYHNLYRYPSITIVDTAGNVVLGDIQYVDDKIVILTFSFAFSGNAYLN